jgi:pimeloyl-ACP methyl ester carboxylesterase
VAQAFIAAVLLSRDEGRWAMRIRRRYLPTRHGDMHVAECGDGPALLMLHSTPRSWRQFLPVLPALAHGFRVILPDTLGFGASDPLPPGVSMEILADSVADVLDALHPAPLPVYGFHTGNKVAAALAVAQPARVTRLMLSGQTHSLIPEKGARDAAIWKIVRKYFAGAPPDGVPGLARKWAADFAVLSSTWWDSHALADPQLDDARLAERERYAADYIAARRSLVPIYHANFAFDFGAALAALRVPTHLVEFAMPAEEHLGRQAQRVAAMLRAPSAATVFENTGSDAHEIRAAELATLIAAFARDETLESAP